MIARLQVADAASVPLEGQFDPPVARVKSPALVPLIAIDEMFRVAVPVFVSTEVNVEPVLTVTLPNMRPFGLSCTAGELGGGEEALTPVPLRAAVCEPPEALSETVSVAENDPVVSGCENDS